MVLLHTITRTLATRRDELWTRRELGRLSDRGLADIGLARGDIAAFAKAAANREEPASAGAATGRRWDAGLAPAGLRTA